MTTFASAVVAAKHGRHRPQFRKLTATWSPGATFCTARPTASTTPAPGV